MPITDSKLSRLRIRHLQLIELIADLGSLRKAAAQLDITQPAASELVRDVERIFGTVLYERSTRGLKARPEAIQLLERARIALRELEVAADELGGSRPSSPQLTVGAVSHAIQHFLPAAVNRLLTSLPDLRLRVREGTINELLAKLQTGELDCVVGRVSPDYFQGSPNGLVFWMLLPEPLCVVVPPHHRLAKRRRVELAEIVDERWALLPVDGLTMSLLRQAFLRAGLSPPFAQVEATSMANSLAIASAAALLTLAPLRQARLDQRQGLLRILPVDLEIPVPPVAFICRESAAGSASLVALRDALLQSVT